MLDLSLVPMDDIWTEIKNRFDAVLLVDLKSYDSDREGCQISYKGGKFICIGLAEHARNKILSECLTVSDREGED